MQPLLFNNLISDLHDGTKCTFSTFPDDTILGGVADTPEGCANTQRCLDRLVKWEKKISLSSVRGSVKSCTWGGTEHAGGHLFWWQFDREAPGGPGGL